MSVKSGKPGLMLFDRSARELPVSKRAAVIFIAFGLAASLPTVAAAYVGPGAGITAIGALWALIAAVVLTLGGLLAWPIRTLLRRRKKASEKVEKSAPDAIDETSGE